jgi:spermidine synthase
MNISGNCISLTTDEHGPIYVHETRTSRILSFDGKIYQSCMKLKDINGLDLVYIQAMMAGLLFVPQVKTATTMGLGAGSTTKNLLSSFSDLNVHAVEYREAVVNAAKEYFYLPETDRLTIHIDDAVKHIKKTAVKSDIIFSDLYSSEGMEPKQIQSSYLRDCKNALNTNGVLVLNIWNTSRESRKQLNKLLDLEFENKLLIFQVESRNVIVLAFKNDIPLITRAELLIKGKLLEEKINIPMERYVESILETLEL